MTHAHDLVIYVKEGPSERDVAINLDDSFF